jgi:hypothetical protein
MKTKIMNKYLTLSLIIFSTVFFTSCSDDNPININYSVISVLVKSSVDSSVIPGANVILYNASNGNSLRRATSGSNGVAFFGETDPGNFYVRITAQNFNELPPVHITPVPFNTSAGATVTHTYYLSPQYGQLGMISGYVNPRIEGILIKASNESNSHYSTYSGPDGYFILFNLPFSNYTLIGLKTGYRSDSLYQVTVSELQEAVHQEISISQVQGSGLTGSVTFLAVNNGIVDISLLDRQSLSAVNGLSALISENRFYNITGIPKGEYLAWASFQNDGYVMDPDWIFRNPGGLNVSFLSDSGSKSLNFSVTGAVSLVFPTNPSNSIIPAEVDTVVPLFSWTAYPQTKEYIIEVRDMNGNLLWGGYLPDGTIRHAAITKETTSVRYNFDGSASAELKRGDIYQWKIYSDDTAVPNIQKLLSSSEDLMGLFRIK